MRKAKYETFDQLIAQALAASEQNDSDAALRLFKQASTQQPGSGIPHFFAAAEYAYQGKIREAETAYANALLLMPDLAIVRLRHGLLQCVSAQAALTLVTRQSPPGQQENESLKLFARGFAELAQNDFGNALTLFEQGMKNNQANLPLNDDIERVSAEIRKLLNKSGEDTRSTADAASDDEDDLFLCKAYRQDVLLH